MSTSLNKKKSIYTIIFVWFYYFLYLLQIVVVFYITDSVTDSAAGDDFSFQLFENTNNNYYTANIDQKVDQSEFDHCTNETNIVTIIPQHLRNINSCVVENVTILASNNYSNRKFSVRRFFDNRNSDNKYLRTWITGFGNWTGISDDANSDDVLAFYSSGFAVGMDRLFGQQLLAGITFGWDTTTISLPHSRNEKFSAGHGHVYFRKIFRRLYIDIEGGIGLGDGKQIELSNLSNGTTVQWNFQCESGTWWEEGLMKIEPFVLLQHAALCGKLRDWEKSTAFAGVRCSWQSEGLFAVSTPRIYAGLIREFGNSNAATTSLFADSPTVFVMPNRNITKTRFFGGCGTTATMGTTLEFYFRYNAEAAANYSSHTLLIGMNWIF
ncbi:MAG: autotransporter outer membrane beta-barrel domain-containing protein [Planctomycetaceae bacterium]|jgi:uncharacterized protein with beta-barrel porin domain|nr:autotransporter outer membrane beta-barrel domain-containing protein [Planctomycetaceae bacterium]